jgi:hypothetical protein
MCGVATASGIGERSKLSNQLSGHLDATNGGCMQKVKFLLARGMQRMHRRGAPSGYYWI